MQVKVDYDLLNFEIYGPYNDNQLEEWSHILCQVAKVIGRHGSERNGCMLINNMDNRINLKEYYNDCKYLSIRNGDPTKLRIYQIVYIISRGYLPFNCINIKKCLSHLCGCKGSACIMGHHIRLENTILNIHRKNKCHDPMRKKKNI